MMALTKSVTCFLGHPVVVIYIKVLELALPSWNSGLTKKQMAEIEWVQRVPILIILRNSKTRKCEFSYNMGLVNLDLEPLYISQEKLCRAIAKKKTLKTKHSDIFT